MAKGRNAPPRAVRDMATDPEFAAQMQQFLTNYIDYARAIFSHRARTGYQKHGKGAILLNPDLHDFVKMVQEHAAGLECLVDMPMGYVTLTAMRENQHILPPPGFGPLMTMAEQYDPDTTMLLFGLLTSCANDPKPDCLWFAFEDLSTDDHDGAVCTTA